MKDYGTKLRQLQSFAKLPFLSGVRGPLPRGSVIVKDLELALFLAERRSERELHPSVKSQASTFKQLKNWTHLREMLGGGFRDGPEFEMCLVIERWFVRRQLWDIAEEAHVDMNIILQQWLVKEEDGLLWRLLYQTYKAGGWPCGWNGSYPDGSLIVYWPYSEEPELGPIIVEP
jgi:hypothetical protein